MYQSEELSLTEKYLLANKVRTKLFSCVQQNNSASSKSDNVTKSKTLNKKHGNAVNRHRSHGQVDFDLRVLVGHAMVLDRLMDNINQQVAYNEERYVERENTPVPAVSVPSSLRNEEKYEYYYSDSDSDSDNDSTEEEDDDEEGEEEEEEGEEEKEFQYTTAPVHTLYSQSNKNILLMDPHRTVKHEYEQDQQIDILEEQCSSDEDSSASEEEGQDEEGEEEENHQYEVHHQDLFFLSQRAASNGSPSDYTVSHSGHGIYTNTNHISNHSTEEVDLGTMSPICV